MKAIRLLSPFAALAAIAALASCSNGLERYPPAIDYDQLELRKQAILESHSRAPAARLEEHSELMDQMDRQLARQRREEESMRLRRIEFLERANREQAERFQAWESDHSATAQQRAASQSRPYPARAEGLELLRRSELAARNYHDELHTRYAWSQGTLYIDGPERIQQKAAALRARADEQRALQTLESQRVMEDARRQEVQREQETRAEADRLRQYAVQQVKPLSPASQPDQAASKPNGKSTGTQTSLRGFGQAAPAAVAGAAPTGTPAQPAAAPQAAPPAGAAPTESSAP